MNSAKSAAILVLFMWTIHLGTSRKCYSYSGTSENEKGTEMTCPEGLDFCQFCNMTTTSLSPYFIRGCCNDTAPNGCDKIRQGHICWWCDDWDLCNEWQWNGSATIGIKPTMAILTAILTIFFGKMV